MSVQEIDPRRLASGEWCHKAEKTIGQGDINAAYSADRIGMGQPIRKPFHWKRSYWICVGLSYCRGTVTAEAYRLVHPGAFKGTATTYAERVADADAARAYVNGFYHGMKVKAQGGEFVLCGPPVVFVPGKEEQLSLF